MVCILCSPYSESLWNLPNTKIKHCARGGICIANHYSEMIDNSYRNFIYILGLEIFSGTNEVPICNFVNIIALVGRLVILEE